MEKKQNAADASDREISITRTLNAPIELVWKVWTSPEHIKNWYGPDGFTNTIHTMDVRPGGVWEFIMHGPDGRDFENKHIFREVVKPERLVMEHVSVPKFTATITFKKDGARTIMNWHMLFNSSEEFQRVVKEHKADQGLKQNVSKLENYLEGMKEKI
jgi:uncharacterized protein YndB with AHSA1/START domain